MNELILSEGISTGELRAVDPLFTYLALVGFAEYFSSARKLFAKFAGADFGPATVERYQQHAIRLLLHGITTPSAAAVDS